MKLPGHDWKGKRKRQMKAINFSIVIIHGPPKIHKGKVEEDILSLSGSDGSFISPLDVFVLVKL